MWMHNDGNKHTDTELQRNVLKFGYGINYKYEGTLSHSFDRFYVVTKFELSKVKDFEFATIQYYIGCKHLDTTKTKGNYPLGLINDIKEYCIKIALHIAYYKKQEDYYNLTAYEILTNELALILPAFQSKKDKREVLLDPYNRFYWFGF